MKIKQTYIWWFFKVNFTATILVWFISRFNLFLISKKIGSLIYLIPSALIYSVIILTIAYLLRNKKRLDTLVYGIIVSIYTITIGLLFNIIFPLCNGNLDIKIENTILFFIIILLITFFVIKLNMKLKKSYKLLIIFILFGIIHFLVISMTYHLNYINFYEYIFNSIF